MKAFFSRKRNVWLSVGVIIVLLVSTVIVMQIQQQKKEQLKHESFVEIIESGNYAEAVAFYQEHYNGQGKYSGLINESMQAYIRSLLSAYKNNEQTYKHAADQLDALERLQFQDIKWRLEDSREEMTAHYIHNILDAAAKLRVDADLNEAFLQQYSEVIYEIHLMITTHNLTDEQLLESYQQLLTTYISLSIKRAELLASKRKYTQAFNRVQTTISQMEKLSQPVDFRALNEKLTALELKKPLSKLSSPGMYVMLAHDQFYKVPEGAYGQNNIYRLENAVLLDSNIPTLGLSDEFIVYEKNASSISAYPVIKTGFTVPAVLTRNIFPGKDKLTFAYSGYNFNNFTYEFINQEQAPEFSRVVNLNETDHSFLPSKQWFIDGEQGEEFVLEWLSGTTLKEEIVTADVQYFTFDKREEIKLPVLRTTKGYFVIDRSQLTSGYYMLEIWPSRHILHVE